MNELLHNLDWVLPLRSDWLTPTMRFFTLLGYEKFILFFLPLGYWAWNRTVFLRLLVLVAITALANAWLKDFWQDPRPDVALRMDHDVGESFGLPSGHAQIAVVLWCWLAYEVRRGWFWLLSAVVVAGIIFSRLYLGAHDIEDVLGGAALGITTLGAFGALHTWKGWREAPAWVHLALIVAVAALAYVTWYGLPPSYVPLLAGLMVGVLYGYRHVHFSVEVAAWRRLLAAVLGALAFLGLQWALKQIGVALSFEGQAWQGLRGLLMGLFVAALMPWLLVRLGLLRAQLQVA
ncbi:phosphatase PAP2 family protein [Metapseudomonas boanensis]|uniref:undecaprenyl-diphosphate phosphatase n=1 Tax=Metapseudomonas boanensis TaxID=2822138 RepID=A0ABS5XK63_9GAMM|nr:phosphatase PAP2 family protein [Pseudomonas boanensis]MBT8768030.1 phosphatase PAP2 family protein [Pseudomonas boanensis]